MTILKKRKRFIKSAIFIVLLFSMCFMTSCQTLQETGDDANTTHVQKSPKNAWWSYRGEPVAETAD